MIIAGSLGSLGNIALTFLPIYFTSLGGSVTQYGMVTAFGMLIGIPSTILGGVIVPRHGLKRIAILTSWFGPCILLGYFLSSDWITLSVIMMLGAAGTIGSSTSRQIIADATNLKNRTAQLSLYQTLSNIPAMFSPLVGGFLIDTMGILEGFRLGALIAIGMSCLSTLVIVIFLHETKCNLKSTNLWPIRSKLQRQQDEEEKLPFSIEKKSQRKEKWKIKGLGIRHLFLLLLRDAKKSKVDNGQDSDDRGHVLTSLFFHLRRILRNFASLPKLLAPILAAYFLVIIANSAAGPYYIFYATDIAKIDGFHWGLILSLQLIIANLIRMPMGMIADRFVDKRKMLLLSIAMTAPLSIVFVSLNSFWGILGVSLAMIATGIHYGPTHEAIQIELTPREKRPTLFATYDVLTNSARFTGVFIGGVLFGLNYTLPFYAFTTIEMCAFAILAATFYATLQRILTLRGK